MDSSHHGTPHGINHNITQIHHWSTSLHSASPLRSIRLPYASPYNRLHIFAISLVRAHTPTLSQSSSTTKELLFGAGWINSALSIKEVRITRRTVEDGLHKGNPVVSVTMSNLLATIEGIRNHPESYLNGEYTVKMVGNGIRTLVPGRIRRLMPGDDARVDVGIEVSNSRVAKTNSLDEIHVELCNASGHLIMKSEQWHVNLTSIYTAYEPTQESLMAHETPRWVGFASSILFNY